MKKRIKQFKMPFKILVSILLITLAFPPTFVGAWGGTFTNPIVNEDTPDQSIIFKDGWYYMTYTHDDYGANSVPLMRSRTLDFRNAEKKVIFTPPSGSNYCKNVWAPELQYLDGKWVIYFAASETDSMDYQRMHAIEADTQDPWGNWTYKGKLADSTDKWAIDGTVFENSGQKYFVWSGWEGDTNGIQNIYIAPMSGLYTISGSRVMISTPTNSWETNYSSRVNEAPQPLIRNGKIFIIYSASGSWTEDYCLGQLSCPASSNPLVASNWTKKSTPVFQKSTENSVYGPGHNTFTKSPDGTEDWLVYHATSNSRDGWNNRKARVQKFTWNSDGSPNFGIPQKVITPMDIPSAVGKFEAEEQVLNRSTIVNNSLASNGKKVGYIDYSDSYVEWRNIRVPTTGTYRLQIRYGNGFGANATHNISVNGASIGEIAYPNTGWDNWGTVSADITLNAGSNTIRLTKGTNYTELDYIDITRFEAEYAGLNRAQVGDNSGASNGKKVGYIDYSTSWVEIRNIQVPSAGTYTMRVRYANGSGSNATHNISVNGINSGTITYPNTGWDNWTSVTRTVNLNAGNNYIRFTKGTNYTELDYIEIYP